MGCKLRGGVFPNPPRAGESDHIKVSLQARAGSARLVQGCGSDVGPAQPLTMAKGGATG